MYLINGSSDAKAPRGHVCINASDDLSEIYRTTKAIKLLSADAFQKVGLVCISEGHRS